MYLEYWKLSSQPFEPIADRAGLYPCEAHEGGADEAALRDREPARRGRARRAGGDRQDDCSPACSSSSSTPASRRSSGSCSRRCRAATCWSTWPKSSAHRRPIRRGTPSKKASAGCEFYLAQNAHLDRHAVVVVDEAHLLEDCGALETLRLLLNFEVDAKPTLTLLLVGQMGLVSAVGRLPSLAERVAVNTLLRAFTAEETAGYVTHRLRAAGAARDLFTPDALEAIHYLGHGIPRQINRLADLALLVGFADRLHELTAEQIEAVSEELVAITAA